MQELILQAEVRTQRGKHTNRLRREGNVPGVFYLHGETNIPITVTEKSLKPLIFTSETHVIQLKLNDGSDRSCILRDMQFDPISDRPVHFDLQGLRANEQINIEVPIVITGGTPAGVRDGGILQHIIHRLKISCLPKDIPEHIEVNAEALTMNHFIHVRDLKIENVTILEHEDSPIAGVVPPTVEKEPEPGVIPAEEVLEPEVIAKGKKPEEGAEEETGDKKTEAAPKTAPAKTLPAKTPPAKEEKK